MHFYGSMIPSRKSVPYEVEFGKFCEVIVFAVTCGLGLCFYLAGKGNPVETRSTTLSGGCIIVPGL
jgi:hypothetical protein